MEMRLVPRVTIMSPCGVEHTSHAVRTNPCPRFTRVAICLQSAGAVFQHQAVLLIVLVMDIGFIKTRKGLVTL